MNRMEPNRKRKLREHGSVLRLVTLIGQEHPHLQQNLALNYASRPVTVNTLQDYARLAKWSKLSLLVLFHTVNSGVTGRAGRIRPRAGYTCVCIHGRKT